MADSAIWVKVFPTTGPGSIGEWAKVTGGTVTEYTKGDGAVMEVHTFTANGTLTVDTPGYAEVLLVGGGSGAYNGQEYGTGGGVNRGLESLPTGNLAVVVGAGGVSTPISSYVWSGVGKPSSLGTLQTGSAGGSGLAGGDASGTYGTQLGIGVTSSITGSAVVYAKSNQASPRANHGDGADYTATGATGVVIVAVQKSAPTVSGVVASGGTESTYVGDGTNGVLGQTYKVHTFTANGTLTVTQGGDADVLIVGGGNGEGGVATYNNGGRVIAGKQVLIPGTLPVVIGGGTGLPSSLGTLNTGGVGQARSSTERTGAGGVVGNLGAGYVSSISGTQKTYASIGDPYNANEPGSGQVAGVVIVRYKV
jgi:hypothetical protein